MYGTIPGTQLTINSNAMVSPNQLITINSRGILSNPDIKHSPGQEYLFTAQDNGYKTIESGMYRVELKAGQHDNPPYCNSSFRTTLRLNGTYVLTGPHREYGNCSEPETVIRNIVIGNIPTVEIAIYSSGGVGGYIKFIPINQY